MSRVISYAVSVLSISIAASVGSSARDDGQFAGSPLKQWFDQLASRKGSVLLICRWRQRQRIGTPKMSLPCTASWPVDRGA
jgi:hypothetical protein